MVNQAVSLILIGAQRIHQSPNKQNSKALIPIEMLLLKICCHESQFSNSSKNKYASNHFLTQLDRNRDKKKKKKEGGGVWCIMANENENIHSSILFLKQ